MANKFFAIVMDDFVCEFKEHLQSLGCNSLWL